MTIVPLGCRVAVARSPDNVERGEDVDHIDLGPLQILGLGNPEKPGSENGKIVKGLVTAEGDCEHHHFEQGQMIWYVDDAAIQLQDTWVVPVSYVLAKEVEDESQLGT